MTRLNVERPAIDEFPPEIVGMIAGHTDHDTMCSLRLSNKWVSGVTTPTFAKAYMAERRHVMSCQSLAVLAEITARKDFGPAVRTILLGSSRWNIEGIDDLRDKIEELEMHHDQNENWIVCDDLVQEQNALDTTLEGVSLIEEALRHISARGQTVVLGTWVNVIHRTERSLFPASSAAPWFRFRRSDYLYSGFGSEKLYGGLFPDDFDHDLDVDHEFTNSSADTLVTILDAIGGDDCPVDGLQLELSGTEDEIEEFSDDSSQALASQVRNLSIRVGLKNELGSGCVPNIESLLRYTNNVDTMSIVFNAQRQIDRSFATANIRQMLRSITTKKLRVLLLASMTIKSAHLVELFKEHKNTLRELVLRFVEVDSDSWDEVFEWMAPNLSLDSLVLKGPVRLLQLSGQKRFPLHVGVHSYHGLAVAGGILHICNRAVEGSSTSKKPKSEPEPESEDEQPEGEDEPESESEEEQESESEEEQESED